MSGLSRGAPDKVKIKVRGDAFEGARAIEYQRRQPHGMGHGAEQLGVAFKPFAVDVGLCRSGLSCHGRSPSCVGCAEHGADSAAGGDAPPR